MTKRFVNDKTLATTERISKLAAELSVSPVTFAVAWTLSHDFVGSSIIGATRPEQLDEILAASELKLSPELLGRVDEITREILYPMGEVRGDASSRKADARLARDGERRPASGDVPFVFRARVPVRGHADAETLAKRRALVLVTEGPPLLQDRNHRLGQA